MRMGQEDRADPLAGAKGRADRCVMGGERRAGIDHCHLAVAHEVGIGAREGHWRGVGRTQPPQPRLQFDRHRRVLASFHPRSPPIRCAHEPVFLDQARFVPRGIYARAALILIVPVLAVQLVVSSVFIQRHYENVTEQMALALSLDLNLILDTYRPRRTRGRAWLWPTRWRSQIEPPRGLTGRPAAVLRPLGRGDDGYLLCRLPDVTGVDLRENWRRAVIGIGPGEGRPAMDLVVARRRLSASNPHQLLVIMASTGVLMTGLAYLFLRNQLRPIRRLAGRRRISARGATCPTAPPAPPRCAARGAPSSRCGAGSKARSNSAP
jgi:hypothetical protein